MYLLIKPTFHTNFRFSRVANHATLIKYIKGRMIKVSRIVLGSPTTWGAIKNNINSMTSEIYTYISTHSDSGSGSGDVPTKLSQLENDSGFITAAENPSVITGIAYLNSANANNSNYDAGVAINTLLNTSTVHKVVINNTFYVSTTIVIPQNKELEILRGCSLILNADIDMVQMDRLSTLKGGYLRNNTISNFSHAMIIIYGAGEPGGATRGVKIQNVNIYSNYHTGSAIELNADNVASAGIDFIEITDVRVWYFEYGIFTVANGGWITALHIKANIEQADCSAYLHADGCSVDLGGQAGVNGSHDYAVEVHGANNHIISQIYDTGLPTFTPYQMLLGESSYGNYIEGFSDIVDQGMMNSVFASKAKLQYLNVGYNSLYQGLSLNALNNTHKRFSYTITKTGIGITGSDAAVIESLVNPSSSEYINAWKTGSSDGTLTIEIPFGATLNCGSIGFASWTDNFKPVHSKVEIQSGGSWYTIIDGANSTVCETISWEHRQVTAVRYTFTISADVRLTKIFASGGTTGNFLKNSGDVMYGNLNMGDNYIVVGNVASLPGASASYRGCLAYIRGNGTSTADIVYICLISAAGTYSWKQLVSG